MKSRILVVDDNVNLTTLLAKTLGRFNYDIVVENDSFFAIDTARRVRPQLILLDVMMPNRDGGEVLLELRNDSELRRIPVILLTALAHEAQGLAAQGGITSKVISKPVELRHLLMEIEQHLDHSQSFTANSEHSATDIFDQVDEETKTNVVSPNPHLPAPKSSSIRAGGAFGGLPAGQKPPKRQEIPENPFSCGEDKPEGQKQAVPTVFSSLLKAMGEDPK